MRHLALALFAAAMVAGFAPASGLASSSSTPTPDPTHPLATQQPASGLISAPASAPRAIGGGASIITGSFGPSREVFGFALASSLADPTLGYGTWDFSDLTTVAYFGLHVQDNGSWAGDSDWTVWNSSQLAGLVSTAHGHGAKVVLTIVLQDFSSGTPHMCAGLAHMSTTIAGAVSEVKAKGVDGVNVDYEGLNGSCGTSDPSWARHTYTTFMAGLRAALGSGYFLSVDTYASSASDPYGFMDVPGLNASVDAFFVMAYDLEYSNYTHSPPSCSSFCLGPTGPLTGYYYNDTVVVSQYTAAVPGSKVILGVPYYGRKACVSAVTPNAVPTSSVVADMYLDAVGESTSPEVKAGSYATHRDANDPSGQERWDTWFNTTLNCTRELYWDDTTSLGHKYDLVNSTNIRGVGIWALNYGGGAPELWQLLASKFAPATPWNTLGGIFTAGPGASSWGATRVDAFGRGSDNGLWQSTWNGSAWNAWTPLGGGLTSGPAAVSWSAGRIDVFARGMDGALWHRYFNGSAWSGWDTLGGKLNQGPAVTSWAAQRLDVFVVGQDNQLWHRYWGGRGWGPWEPLGGILSAGPGAVSWGPNRIDIFAPGSDGQMWHKYWGGTGWSAWEPLGGRFISGAAVASCASGHLDVFAIGSDRALWHLGWNGTHWTGWQRQGGYWNAEAPTAVCPPGATAAYVFERGQDKAMWQTAVAGS